MSRSLQCRCYVAFRFHPTRYGPHKYKCSQDPCCPAMQDPHRESDKDGEEEGSEDDGNEPELGPEDGEDDCGVDEYDITDFAQY